MHTRFATVCAAAGIVSLMGACAAPAEEGADEAASEENVGVTSQELTLAEAKAGQRAATLILQKLMRPSEAVPTSWTTPGDKCWSLGLWIRSWRTYYGNGGIQKVVRRPNQTIAGLSSIVVRFYFYPDAVGYHDEHSNANALTNNAVKCYGAPVASFMVLSQASQLTPEGYLWFDLDPEVATLTSTLSTTWGAKASAKSNNDGSTFDAYRMPSSWSSLSSLSGIPAGTPCSSTSATLYSGATLTEISSVSGTKRKCVAAPSSGEVVMYP